MNHMDSIRPGPLRRLGAVAAVLLGFLLLAAAPAMAHVDLASSTPADGTSVSAAPRLIQLVFTSEAVPAGEGIVLASADGAPVDAVVAQPESTVIHVVPTEPLVNGVYGVLWMMRAGDSHPRSGTITFEVDAPPLLLEETAPAPDIEVVSGDGPDESVPVETEPEASSTVADDADTQSGVAPRDPETAEASPATEVALEPVFEVPSIGSATGDWLARIGRWAAMTGTLVGIGAFAFAATSLIGTRREVEQAGYWVRRSALLIIAGTVVEVLGSSMALAGSVPGGLAPSALFDVVAGSFGLAVLLRVVGGAAMLQGTEIVPSGASTPIVDGSRLPAPRRGRSTVAVVEPAATGYRLDVHHERIAMVGIALVTASYLFDGHTATTAPAALVRAASAIHVLAAAVWVGGVMLMAWTLSSRYRRGEDLHAAPMAIRFSRVASVALASVAVAGTALALAIADAPSDLVTTSWGRALIVKLIAVAIAAAIGAYNHFVTVPALESDPTDDDAANRLRRLVRLEGTVLLLVVAVTAVLVGAAS